MSGTYATSYDAKMFAQVEYRQLGFSTDGDMESFIDGVLIPMAQKLIDNFCNHDFASHTGGTITLDGTGKKYVTVKPEYYPLQSLTSVSIDGVSKTVSDFKVYDQSILYDSTFTEDEQNVVIVADYGYPNGVPSDVEFVCASICANMLQYMLKSRIMPDKLLPSLEAGKFAASLMSSPKIFTDELKEILTKYVAIGVDVG